MDYAWARSVLVPAGFPETMDPPMDIIYRPDMSIAVYSMDQHTSLEISISKPTGKIAGITRVENADQAKGERDYFDVSEVTVTRKQIRTTTRPWN